MESIKNLIEIFKMDNPAANDDIIVDYLENMGYSEFDINSYFNNLKDEMPDGLKLEDIEVDPTIDTCDAIPDLDDRFDLPEDVKKEIKS